jgi:hypothetical protein
MINIRVVIAKDVYSIIGGQVKVSMAIGVNKITPFTPGERNSPIYISVNQESPRFLMVIGE